MKQFKLQWLTDNILKHMYKWKKQFYNSMLLRDFLLLYTQLIKLQVFLKKASLHFLAVQ